MDIPYSNVWIFLFLFFSFLAIKKIQNYLSASTAGGDNGGDENNKIGGNDNTDSDNADGDHSILTVLMVTLEVTGMVMVVRLW